MIEQINLELQRCFEGTHKEVQVHADGSVYLNGLFSVHDLDIIRFKMTKVRQ